MPDTGSLESVKDAGTEPTAKVGYWLQEIRAYETTFKDWHLAAERAIKRYRNDADTNSAGHATSPRKFNIFWSNVQTLQPALYSRTPKADVSRTHKDRNPVARASAVILERAVREELKYAGFDDAMRAGRDDYLLTARGQCWVRYVPTYGEETKDRIFLQSDVENEQFLMPDGAPVAAEAEVLREENDDGSFSSYIEEGEPYKPVVSECVKVDHINWHDFGHTPAPTWKKVRAVWKRELMTRDQLRERFKEAVADAIGMSYKVPNIADQALTDYGDAFKRAEVYEIWDKTSRKVIWISPGYTQGVLDEIDDPLKLESFFPCPKPLYGTLTTDSLIPVPDYDEYRAQAEEIDLLTERIRLLTKALKVAGAYDSSAGDALARIFSSDDNTMIPVDNWAMFAEKGGVAGVMSLLPIRDIALAIKALTEIREQAKRDLHEVSGVADIMRGQSDPNETLGAQQIKSQFGGMRIEDRQANMGRFARDTVQIVAEIIAEHFSPETLWGISGWEFTTEARVLDKAVEAYEKKMQAMMAQMQQPPMAPPGGPQMPMGVPPMPPPMPAMPPPGMVGPMPQGMPGG
jgi:hypothetical protein